MDYDELVQAHTELMTEHKLLASRVERMFRFGPVLEDADVDVSDPKKPRARIHIDNDSDGKPVKGAWLPYATIAGARNQHSAPSKGQHFLQIAVDGDHQMGLLIPLTHSENVQSPSTDPKTHIDQIGKTKLTQADGTWKQEVENASISLTAGKLVITAGATIVTYEDGKVTFDTKAVKFGKNANLGVSIQGTVDNGGFVDQGPFSAIVTTE